MRADDYSWLNIELGNGVAVATMSHPDPTAAQREEYDRLLHDVAEDDDVRTLVLTGWSSPRQGPQPGEYEDFTPFSYYDRAGKLVRKFLDLDKPVIMALDGDPGVLTIPLTGDIVIAERQCTFVDNHVLIGTASATQPFLWPLSTGLLRAKRWILTGEQIGAEEAERIGLVTEVVDTGMALTRAREYAAKFAAMRPETLQATKRTLNQWMRMGLNQVYDHGLALEFMLFPRDFVERYQSGAVMRRS